MRYAPDRRHRRSLRIKGFDYARHGAFFLTLCVFQRECVFGEIEGDAMALSEVGRAVQRLLRAFPCRFRAVRLDAFVLMPNHLHAVLLLCREQPVSQPNGGSDKSPVDAVSAACRQICARIAGRAQKPQRLGAGTSPAAPLHIPIDKTNNSP